MNRTEHLLTILSEECAEVIKDVSKTLRFGVNDHYPGICKPTNIESVYREFCDIVAMMEMLDEAGVICSVAQRDFVEEKKQRVLKYLEYSRDMGTLTN